MESICQRIHLKQSDSGNKKIYPGMDITKEKAQNTEHRWSRLRKDNIEGVIDGNESHPIRIRNRGQAKTRKFLTIEGGWYRCGSI